MKIQGILTLYTLINYISDNAASPSLDYQSYSS